MCALNKSTNNFGFPRNRFYLEKVINDRNNNSLVYQSKQYVMNQQSISTSMPLSNFKKKNILNYLYSNNSLIVCIQKFSIYVCVDLKSYLV